jgi:putative nucleotidyltransferase with HDIG domain
MPHRNESGSSPRDTPMDIVIIDDSPIIIALLKKLVSRMDDCRAIPFTSASQALGWCIENEPDLVIVDYMMPEMDGIQFTRRFRLLPGKSDTPVLMVTAAEDRELRHRALTLGINDFLNKPFDQIELEARARNMLALRSSQKKLANRALLLADEVAKATVEIVNRERETLLCLGRAAEHRDPETHEHIIRMSNYSQLVARQMGFNEAACELMLLSAPLHDIGKIGTPDNILLKPGKLTIEEFEIMKQHTAIGAKILSNSVSPILQAGARIAISHHEKFDGSGYPRGLKGTAIPLEGRIVAVADVFDALTSERPYKKAWDIDRATALLVESRGGHFDPDVVDAFFDVFDEVLEIKQQYQDADMLQASSAGAAAAAA